MGSVTKDNSNCRCSQGPWRLVQTNLREIDMDDMDARQFVADLTAFKANAVMISTSGIVANYRTKLPYHFQNQYLNGDTLEDVIRACHAAGIKVIARMDFSKVRRIIYENNPDWAFVSAKGQIIDYNGDVHVCFNSVYQQELSLEIMKETIETLDVDGAFFNMDGYHTNFDYSGNYYGICQCSGCKARFESMYGEKLPVTEDPNNSTYQKYLEFQDVTVKQHREKVYRFLKELRPDFCIANHYEFNEGFVRNEAATSIHFPYWQYYASDNTKTSVATFPGMLSSAATVDFVDIEYRHAAVSPYQQERRLFQSIANGGALDYYIMGRLDNHEDRSGFDLIKKVYHYHADHESEYTDLTSTAQIALFQDGRIQPWIQGGKEASGWFRFLTENHFLFDSIDCQYAASIPLDKYKLIILPDIKKISGELADRLDRFAEAGGTVIAISGSGIGNGPGGMSALKCTGLRRVKAIREDMRPSYLKFDETERFPRLPDTDLIYLYGQYVYAEYESSVKGFMKLVPPHMFGPPERCYYTVVTDYPGYTINPFGKGRGVYIPWNIGDAFYAHGHLSLSDFAADLLQHVLGIEPIGGNVSRTVEMTLQKKGDDSAYLLHLINGSGLLGNSFYEPIRMSDVQVSLPFTQKVETVLSLANGKEYDFHLKDGTLEINIGTLDHFDAIKISISD